MNSFVSESFSNGTWITSIRHTESVKEKLLTLSPETFQIALNLAIESIEHLHSSTASYGFKDALKKEMQKHTSQLEQLKQLHLSEKKALELKYTSLQAELQQQLSELKSHLTSSDTAYKSLRNQFETLQESASSAYTTSLQTIVQQKELQYTQELSRIQSMHSGELDRMEKGVKERMDHCESHYSNALLRIESLYAEKEQALRKESEKLQGSSERGKAGEKEIEELFDQYTSWGPLTNTSKLAHGTDRSCTVRNCLTLIEVKNYTSVVPSKEVEKFYRDMEQHQDAPFGVFLSLHSDITGKKSKGFFQIAWTPRSQMLVFINSFYSHSAEDVLTFIDLCVDLAKEVYTFHQSSQDSSDSSLHLQSRIEQAKVFLEKELKRATELLATFQIDKKHLIDVITKQHTNYKYQVEQSKHALQTTLQILLDTYEEQPVEPVNVVEETPMVLESPTPVESLVIHPIKDAPKRKKKLTKE